MYGGDLHPSLFVPAAFDGWPAVEQLLAIEMIRRTKALYCFCLDTRDWDGYQALFLPDAVLEVPADVPDAPVHRIAGAVAIRRFVESAVGGVNTTHHCHTPIINFRSPNEAVAVWAMQDLLSFPPGSSLQTLHGTGHYFEVYRRDGARWCISHCRLTRLRVETT